MVELFKHLLDMICDIAPQLSHKRFQSACVLVYLGLHLLVKCCVKTAFSYIKCILGAALHHSVKLYAVLRQSVRHLCLSDYVMALRCHAGHWFRDTW